MGAAMSFLKLQLHTIAACSAFRLDALQPASTPSCLQEDGDNLLDNVTEAGIADLVAFCRNANRAGSENTGESKFETGRHLNVGCLCTAVC